MDRAFDLAALRNGILCVCFETAFVTISDNRSENAADMMGRMLALINSHVHFVSGFVSKRGIHYYEKHLLH